MALGERRYAALRVPSVNSTEISYARECIRRHYEDVVRLRLNRSCCGRGTFSRIINHEDRVQDTRCHRSCGREIR